MFPLVVFPDAALVVITALAELGTVVSKVPTDRPDTFILVRRVGGTSRDVVVDDPTLTVEAWAPTDEEAHDLLQEARAILHSLPGSMVGDVPVYRVQEFAGPASLPDPDSTHPRYTLTASVSVRGTTPIGS